MEIPSSKYTFNDGTINVAQKISVSYRFHMGRGWGGVVEDNFEGSHISQNLVLELQDMTRTLCQQQQHKKVILSGWWKWGGVGEEGDDELMSATGGHILPKTHISYLGINFHL